jgi:uncharacterized protein (DUF58 family)
MIAPRSTIIFLTAIVVIPAATVLFAIPSLAPVSALILVVFILAAVVDALFLRPNFSLIRVVLPDVVRLAKGRDGKIDIKFVNESPELVRFRAGFAIPAEIGAAVSEWNVELPSHGRAQLISIQCEPKQRGRFLLRNCYLQEPSRLGLWNVWHVLNLQCEIRVYPDLLSEQRHITALFLRRGMHGFRQYRQVGKGREFEKLREYIPGDSVEDVHWKATAKRGHPVTKVFQIERTQEVYVIVDCSRLTARWSGDGAILERFLNSTLILSLAAARQGDLFGLVTFSDKVQTFIRAKNGKPHYDVCRDAIYSLQPKPVTPDFEDLFSFLRLRLRRRALLVFFTALDDPALAESFVGHVDLLTRQHLILVNMIQPSAAHPLFAKEDVSEVDDIYRRLGGHLLWVELQEVRKRFQRLGVEFSLLAADQFAAETVNAYFRVKQRQLL